MNKSLPGQKGGKSFPSKGQAGSQARVGTCPVCTWLMSVPLCSWCSAEEFGPRPKDTVEPGKGFQQGGTLSALCCGGRLALGHHGAWAGGQRGCQHRELGHRGTREGLPGHLGRSIPVNGFDMEMSELQSESPHPPTHPPGRAGLTGRAR